MSRYRIDAICSEELWQDEPALKAWAKRTVVSKLDDLGFELLSPEIGCIRESIKSFEGETVCKVAIVLECASLPYPMPAKEPESVTLIDLSQSQNASP